MFLLMLFMFFSASFLNAVEIELTGGMNKMTFHPDRVTAHNQSVNFRQFQPYPFGTGDLIIRGEFSDKLGFNTQISRDNILWNSLYAKLTFNTDFVRAELGPFMNVTDDWITGNREMPVFGAAGGIQFMYPGIVFLSLGGSSSIGSGFEQMNNNSRQTAQAELGFWLSNMIPSFSASFKNYSRHTVNPANNNPVVVEDTQLRLQASFNFFAKNSPVTLRIDGAYEILRRTYNAPFSNVTDELSAFLAGLELRWQVSRPLRIIAGFEIPVFYSAEDNMIRPGSIFDLYRFHGGIVYSFFPRRRGF